MSKSWRGLNDRLSHRECVLRTGYCLLLVNLADLGIVRRLQAGVVGKSRHLCCLFCSFSLSLLACLLCLTFSSLKGKDGRENE